jgi:diguanylate cyclase (GGDEF)-like protein
MENEGEDELIEFIDLHPKKILTVSVEDDLFDAYRLMRSARIRHLVVVDEFGKFVRVIESCDLVSFLTEIAIEDELTGLYNRRYFEFLLEKFRDSDKEIGIIFIDVNKFKELNDTYGHLFGDKVLYEVAKRIKSSIREIDHAFRYGGDEFVVMSFISAQDLKVIAKRLKNILNFEINNIKIKTSIGWAHYPNDSTDLYEVVEIADKMMYKNKKEEDD